MIAAYLLGSGDLGKCSVLRINRGRERAAP